MKNSKAPILRILDEDPIGFTRKGQLREIILERYKRLLHN